jgi:hypothetical protein
MVTSRSGLPNVEVDGAPYHSTYDPAREAEKFCATHPIEQADVVMVFGWGLGHLADALLKRVKASARVIVFEPDPQLHKLSKRPKDARFRFVVGDDLCRFFDEWTLEGCQETDEFLWLMWPAALRFHGSTAESLKASFKTRLRDRAANLLTHFKNGSLYFENALANFEYQAGPDAGALFGRFKNVPLVMVSAGPSLDRNIHELRGMEDRCFILAADTALRPLLAAGITPHALIMADPSTLNARHVTGVIPPSTWLIAEQAVQNSALRTASRRMLFSVGVFPDSLLAKFGLAKSRLEAWGSVATSALDLACRMGANPIIFAGQDFAYSWEREYASHTIFHANPFSAELGSNARAKDIFDNEAYTTENFIAYRDFFVRKIKRTPGVRFINATEGGILTEAVEIMPLRQALRDFGRGMSDVGFRSPHPTSHVRRPKSALEHLHKALKTRNTACGCLAGFLELTAKEHLLKKNQESIENTIQWGLSLCERALSSEPDSLEVGAG